MKRRPPVALLLSMVTLGACVSVLGVRPQSEQPFSHRAHLLKGVSCVQCHAQVAKSTPDSPVDLPGTEQCVSCHAEPHDRSPCGNCHGQPHTRAAVKTAKAHLRFSHAKHEEVSLGACVRCHRGVEEGDGPLRPTMATCFTCHTHSDEWTAFDCSACHRDMEGEATRPTSHVVHGNDFVARHGAAAASARDLCSSCHSESSCAACHGARVPALPNVLRFDRVTNGQLHRAGFKARHSLEARAAPSTCMVCHSESTCRDCHAEQRLVTRTDPRVAPHPPGFVGPPGTRNDHGPQARRDPMACASCHSGPGETLCVGCHRVGGPGGNPHPQGFASTKRSSELPCRRCHGGEL